MQESLSPLLGAAQFSTNLGDMGEGIRGKNSLKQNHCHQDAGGRQQQRQSIADNLREDLKGSHDDEMRRPGTWDKNEKQNPGGPS